MSPRVVMDVLGHSRVGWLKPRSAGRHSCVRLARRVEGDVVGGSIDGGETTPSGVTEVKARDRESQARWKAEGGQGFRASRRRG